MKRKPEFKASARFGDILKSTTVEQRAWIGAVALAYNDTEDSLHRLAGACIQYSPYASVTSRINGTDGLVAIILECATSMGLRSAPVFNTTLAEQGFGYLKTLRDAVIHAKILDSDTGIGTAPGKRGKKPEEILLSPKALEGLYQRLIFVGAEINSLETVINCAKAIRLFQAFDALDDERRQYNELDIKDALARCLRNQKQRLSLPPFPKFPDAPDPMKVMAEWPASLRNIKVQLREK